MEQHAPRTIADIADDLAALAREARALGEVTLAYLIDMAVIEAARSRLISDTPPRSPLGGP